jgi:hypothetical protein
MNCTFNRFILFTGDMWQLPPIFDNIIMDNNHLDGRPDFSPSHWKENFKIFYLTEKMRSHSDLEFSSLCDRVGRNRITEADEMFLKSRIEANPNEEDNESFKTGKLSIIVTTNMKREFVNSKMLSKLLPNGREYSCSSVDRVVNLPKCPSLSENDQLNLSKTGNLPTMLKLKVGAPVVITSNHPKAKYKEDGIVNGARGFVQAAQTSEDNPDKVEIIWVVFNNEKIGRLYRFENNNLRQKFNPGHPLATPIFPERKKFSHGNVQYQRSNFALSLAYALTAHKCQGETLEEVIIDFGPDKERGIKNFICPGSFYVALTRVREGKKVFLKSFEKSYIVVNEKIEEKISAMRKFNSYQFKKIYLDENIFEKENSSVKIGYLNINGLLDGGHAEYLNEDKNLNHLDLLTLAETKLDKKTVSSDLDKVLSNWNIVCRYDADDASKHMGLIVLASKKSGILHQLQSFRHQTAKRDDHLQIQGIIVRLRRPLSIGFIYCRTTPNNAEIKGIKKCFKECQIVMGDFNLSPRISKDLKKLNVLCGNEMSHSLKEITRRLSNSQPDHILILKKMEKFCYVISFYNFISDHNSIVIRVGDEENSLTKEIVEKINFDAEKHLKSNKDFEERIKVANKKTEETRGRNETRVPSQEFKRRILNPDTASCWLNACLQMILTAFDHLSHPLELNSELGNELMRIQNQSNKSIDPTTVKSILVLAEDTRIAVRKSEIMNQVVDEQELERQLRSIEDLHLNLRTGQQCVRDFFLCLKENLENWVDVYQLFCLNIIYSTTCVNCGKMNESEQNQLYVELDVPPNGSNLNEYVEKHFNGYCEVDYNCQDGCNVKCGAENRSMIKSCEDVEFLIVILRRVVQGEEGPMIIQDSLNSTYNICLR